MSDLRKVRHELRDEMLGAFVRRLAELDAVLSRGLIGRFKWLLLGR